MKKILILGVGNAQKDIIELCRKKGMYVYAVSNTSGYLAEKLADEFYQIDIVDADGIIKFAEEKKIDYIYSVGSDVAMPTVARASEALGLPCFFDEQTATACNHKQLLRQVLKEKRVEGNIPYQMIQSSDEEIMIDFPVMMKPSDSQGQRGVRKVKDIDELKKHFDDTLGFSREKKVILESFIDGDEISVNVFVKDGVIKFYLISDRKVWDEYPGGIIHEHIIPSKYEKKPEIADQIKILVVNTLEAINLKNGPAYFQIKISSMGKPYLIEVTPRLDGCHMWRLIEYTTGVNLLEASLELLEGKTYSQREEFDIQPFSLEFMCGKPDTEFRKSDHEIPENVYMQWYYEDGQQIRRMNGYYEKCGYAIKKGR